MGKTLGTRQKLSFRIEPSQRNLKPRSPLVPPSRQYSGPPHTSTKQQQEAETASGKNPDQTPQPKAT